MPAAWAFVMSQATPRSPACQRAAARSSGSSPRERPSFPPALAEALDDLSDTPIVVLAAPADEPLAAAALDLGAADYLLTTPSQLRRLPGLLDRIARLREQERQLSAAQQARAAAERELDATRAYYHLLTAHLPQAISMFELDTPGMEPCVTRQIEAIFGYTAEEWLAEPSLWRRTLHPDDRERVSGPRASTAARCGSRASTATCAATAARSGSTTRSTSSSSGVAACCSL